MEIKKSAEWAESPSTRAAMLESWSDSDSNEVLKVGVLLILSGCELMPPVSIQEIETNLKEQGDKPISSSDLITDRKVIHSLCILYSSMVIFKQGFTPPFHDTNKHSRNGLQVT